MIRTDGPATPRAPDGANCELTMKLLFLYNIYFMAVSLPLEDSGADAAHGVGLTPQAVLGHVILQHPQPHGLASDIVMNHDESQLTQHIS